MENDMTKTKLLAAAAIISGLIATPVLAGDFGNGRSTAVKQHQQRYSENYNSSGYRDTGFWPADSAAGVVGGAISTAGAIAGGAVNTAGAIATAPFRDTYAWDDGYDGDWRTSQSYAARNGFVCQPGTLFRGEDGRRHICQ
jgi:hypothetical protein